MKKVISLFTAVIWFAFVGVANASALPPPPKVPPVPAPAPETAPVTDATPAPSLETVPPDFSDTTTAPPAADTLPSPAPGSPPADVPGPAHTGNSSGTIRFRNVMVDGQAFMFCGAAYDHDNKYHVSACGLSRGLLNFRFDPADKLSFRFSTDVVSLAEPGTLPELEGGSHLIFKFASVELKELFPFAEKLSIFGGLVDNVWNTHAENTSGLRYVMQSPITRYGFAPESDLGVWLRGELFEGFKLSLGVSNGTGAFAPGTEKAKALDFGAFYQLADPVNLGLAGYVRWSLDRSLAIPGEVKNVHSVTAGFNATLRGDKYRVGLDYLFHIIMDFTPDGLGGIDTYRHSYHVVSLYGVVRPVEKFSGFLRFDNVVYTTKWLESYTHNGQTLLAGVAYHFNRYFTVAVDFSYNVWSWDSTDPNHKARTYKDSVHSYAEPTEIGLFMEGAKGVFVHTEWKF